MLTEIPPVYKRHNLSHEEAQKEFPFATPEELKMVARSSNAHRTVDGVLRLLKAQLGSDFSKAQVTQMLEAFHIPAKGTRQYRRQQEKKRRAEALLKRRMRKRFLKQNYGDQLVRKIYT